jgi:ferric-dicitrate binding protein FerR (iron transport regulator)
MPNEFSSSPIPDALLGAYFAGECTLEERAQVETWLEDTEHQAIAELVQMGWNVAARPELDGNVDLFLARLARRRDAEARSVDSSEIRQSHAVVPPRPVSKRPIIGGLGTNAARGWLGIAAAVLIGVVGVLAFHIRDGKFAHRIGLHAYMTYATHAGQSATIVLRDGTRVALNVASTLKVPKDFGATNRHIVLEGQARFEVKHTTAHPFVVDAQQTRTTVLGTTFGVRAYGQHVRVVVKSGKVAVVPCVSCGRDKERMVASANDAVVISPDGTMRMQHDVDVDTDLAFAGGQLVFSWVPLRDAIADLDRWYDVDIRLADSALANQRLKGSLPPGAPSDLVRMLEITLGARVVQEGRVVTVYQR